MKEILRTNDAVKLNYALVRLEEAGCQPFSADRYMSSAEGSIPALQRRILVPDEHEARAKQVIATLDEGDPLPDDFPVGEPDEDM